ncbi:unnamed protein product, partial [Vitis vinifera]
MEVAWFYTSTGLRSSLTIISSCCLVNIIRSYCFKAWRRCGKNLVLLPNFFWKIQKFINTYCYCIKLLAQILYSDEL